MYGHLPTDCVLQDIRFMRVVVITGHVGLQMIANACEVVYS